MRLFRRRGRALKRRYGHAGGPKRSEGVHVAREPGRMYYVKGDGAVWSAPMKGGK